MRKLASDCVEGPRKTEQPDSQEAELPRWQANVALALPFRLLASQVLCGGLPC